MNTEEHILSWTTQLDELVHAYEGLVDTYWADQDNSAALDHVVAAAEELTAQLDQFSTTLEAVRGHVDALAQAAEAAAQGPEQLRQQALTQKTMGQQFGAQVQSLVDRVTQVNQLVAVVTDVAESTNLLALNAAIEAARAGDAGQGFAVVADEVKKLAQASQDAAHVITRQLEQVREAFAALDEAQTRIGNQLGALHRTHAPLTTQFEAVTAAAEALEPATTTVTDTVRQLTAMEAQWRQTTARFGAAFRQWADQLRQMLNAGGDRS